MTTVNKTQRARQLLRTVDEPWDVLQTGGAELSRH
jgi:hypothetical protein